MAFLGEFRTYVRRGIIISIFISACILVSIVLYNFSALVAHEAELDFDKYSEVFNDGQYYGVGDTLIGEYEKEFIELDNHAELLAQFNDWLHNNGKFEYYEGRNEGISYADKYNSKTSEGYFKERMITYWLSPNEIQHFDIKVCEGRNIVKEDFVHTKGMANEPGQISSDEICVLAGHMMRSKYSIGDTIDMYHILFAGKARIVGFLEEKTNVVDSMGNVQSLDNTFVFPFFNSFSGNESTNYMRILYLQRNFGKVYTKYSVDDIQEMFNEYTSFLGIPGSYRVGSSSNRWQPVFSKNLSDVVSGLKGIAIGISSFSAGALALYMFVKIRKSLKYYGVLLLNGFTGSQVKKMIFGEVLLLMSFSFAAGLIISHIIKDSYYREYDINMLAGVIPMFIIGLFGATVAVVLVNRYDIASSIGRQE